MYRQKDGQTGKKKVSLQYDTNIVIKSNKTTFRYNVKVFFPKLLIVISQHVKKKLHVKYLA